MSIIEEENSLLKERVDLLIKKNEQLKKYISSLQELLATDICKFFEITKSIKQTRKRFCYESVRECYGDLVYFYGCTGPIQDAEDYKECYKDIFGSEYINDDSEDDNDENVSIENTFNSMFEMIFQNIIENTNLNADLNPDLNVE